MIGRAETAAIVALALAAALFILLDLTHPIPATDRSSVGYTFVFGDAVARPGAYPFLRTTDPGLVYVYKRAGGDPNLVEGVPAIGLGLPAVIWFDRVWLGSPETGGGLIDLNRASVVQLRRLPGIGEVLARRIVAGRPYSSVEELLRVEGIGGKKLDAIRGMVKVGP